MCEEDSAILNGLGQKSNNSSRYVIFFSAKKSNFLISSNFKITPPALPDKAWKRQIPFMKETLFDDQFIEDRRRALDQFINK